MEVLRSPDGTLLKGRRERLLRRLISISSQVPYTSKYSPVISELPSLSPTGDIVDFEKLTFETSTGRQVIILWDSPFECCPLAYVSSIQDISLKTINQQV